jgi:hypothetical protein
MYPTFNLIKRGLGFALGTRQGFLWLNNIRSVRFNLKHFDFYLPAEESQAIIAASLRAAIRNLATYKSPEKEQQCSFFASAGYHRWIKAYLTIKAENPQRPEVIIEVYKDEPDLLAG